MTIDTAIQPRSPHEAFTLPTGPGDTARVASALAYAAQVMTDHHLHANSVECTVGPSKEWDPTIPHTFDLNVDGFTLPGLPRIGVRVHFHPDAFYRWCQALDIERIDVERRPGVDTLLHTEIRAHGFTWTISGDLTKPAKPHPYLPGITQPWVRENGRATNYGHISRDDLRQVLTTLGVLDGSAAS